jgi:hypothetical protein
MPIPITVMRRAARRRAAATSVEDLLVRLDALSGERQRLRARGAGRRTLERNRRRIVRAQWELSHALITKYLPARRDAA